MPPTPLAPSMLSAPSLRAATSAALATLLVMCMAAAAWAQPSPSPPETSDAETADSDAETADSDAEPPPPAPPPTIDPDPTTLDTLTVTQQQNGKTVAVKQDVPITGWIIYADGDEAVRDVKGDVTFTVKDGRDVKNVTLKLAKDTGVLPAPKPPTPLAKDDPDLPSQGVTPSQEGAKGLGLKREVKGLTNIPPDLRYDCDQADAMAQAALQAQRDPNAPPRMQYMEIKCDLQVCQEPGVKEQFRRLMDVCVGMPYDKRLMAAAANRTLKTGFFEKASFDFQPVKGGYKVLFDLTGATLINEVTFTGIEVFTGPVLESEVERRLQMRRGQHYTNDPIANQKRQLVVQDFYEQKGYRNTKVKISSKRVPGPDKLVNIQVRIDRGKPMEVRRVVINRNPAMTYAEMRSQVLKPIGWFEPYTKAALSEGIQNLMNAFRERGYYAARLIYRDTKEEEEEERFMVDIYLEVDEGPKWEVEFQGNTAFAASELREQITFAQSGYVDEVEITNTIDAIRSFYETAGYYKVEVDARMYDLSEDLKRLTFVVNEGKRAEIRTINVIGNTNITDEELLPQLGTTTYGLFGTGGFLQRQQINDDLGKLTTAYQNQGWLNARAPRWRMRTVDEGTGLELVVEVEEGERTQVNTLDIQIDDPESPVSKTQIMKVMRQQRERLELDPEGETLSIKWLTTSNLAIASLYESKGYPLVEVAIECRESDYERNPKADKEATQDTKPQDGAPNDSDADTDANKDKDNGPKNAADKAPGTEGADKDENDGWGECKAPSLPDTCFPKTHSERVELCEPCPGDAGVLCCQRVTDPLRCYPQDGLTSTDIDVRVKVNPGPQIRVGEVFLRGNFNTIESVIFDELPIKSGDLFYTEKIFEGQSNLRRLGLFESVSIDAIGYRDDLISLYSTRDRASLLVLVEEATSLFWDLSIGAEGRNLLDADSGWQLTLETALVETNFFGTGIQTQIKLKYAFDIIEAWDTYNDPSLAAWDKVSGFLDWERLLALELSMRNPRFLSSLGLRRLDLTITPFYSEDLLGLETIDLDKVELGVRNNVRKTFLKRDRLITQVTVEYKRTTTRRRDEDPRTLNGERLFDPWRNTTLLSPSFTLDFRDSSFNPMRGWLLDFTLDFAIAFLESPTEFVRATTSWAQFFSFPGSFSANRRLTLGYGFQIGRVIPLGDTEVVPDDERYRLGGGTSLRGFEDNAVGPRNVFFQSLGGELIAVGHLELRYPLVRNFLGIGDLYGAYFFDSGLLVDCLEDLPVQDRLQDPERLDSCLNDIKLGAIRNSGGLSLRWLISNTIPLSLDYGVILNRRVGEEFSNVNANIGYTF